jgi:hypothetical protein
MMMSRRDALRNTPKINNERDDEQSKNKRMTKKYVFHKRASVIGWNLKIGLNRGSWNPVSARTSAGALGTERKETYRWKLFHREQRPTPERNIIDTSERARANYRYVIGQHWILPYTSGRGQLANFVTIF